MMDDKGKVLRFAIDRGGTFTDIYCEVIDKSSREVLAKRVLKLLSEDPSSYADAPTEGIRRLLEQETGAPHPRGVPVDTSCIECIRMGTTVATNALLERQGERTALLTTKGFKDLQQIGNQSRPRIFDLQIQRPELLYETVHEIDERVILVKDHQRHLFDASALLEGSSHELLHVEKEIDEGEVRTTLKSIFDSGFRSIAVVFLHSYTYPAHELLVQRVAREMGFQQISISSEIMPMIRAVPRGGTTCVDAYLTPVLKRYLQSFAAGFDAGLRDVNVTFMQSDGGLTPMDSFFGNKAILSGPAGGVVGYAVTSQLHSQAAASADSCNGSKGGSSSSSGSNGNGNGSAVGNGSSVKSAVNVIGFDMGGTSTDVSRYAGTYEHVFETTTAGVTIQSPQLDINTVAAGGGSRLFYRNGMFEVGPQSAGAHPGPVCYRKGGPLAVTDANVFLGRVQPHLFPKIFGPNENEALDYEGSKRAFEELTEAINAEEAAERRQYTPQEVAYGFIRIANEAMARPIRNLTTMKGYDVTKHALACFGGAGPQHCCAIAKLLGMKRVFVHRYSGILSAFGLSLADVVVEKQEPFSSTPLSESLPVALKDMQRLEQQARQELRTQGFTAAQITVIHYLNCRYAGTDTAIMTDVGDGRNGAQECEAIFTNNYRREFGFELHGRAVLIDDIRVRAVGLSHSLQKSAAEGAQQMLTDPPQPPVAHEQVQTYFNDRTHDTPVFIFEQLLPFQVVKGPAIIIQNVATVVVEPGCTATITAHGDIEIIVEDAQVQQVSTTLDPIYLSVFSHRFMGIAEQMGRTLQRTSVSVNIKERLDFSCALFDPKGGLVANAPHLPVHLGAMSDAVKYQVKYWGDDLRDGDVLVSNHPQLAGGSHLPDITVITPVFRDGQIVFFVASRGHHADVGGIAPGSMPPLSKSLLQEGAAIIAFKLVEGGVFQEEGVSQLLLAPQQLPGNSGTRNLQDNISDLKAQVAANKKGAHLMQQLVDEYGLDVVCAYMNHIQTCSEHAVRDMLKAFSEREGMKEIDTAVAEDFLDDGTPIRLAVTIDRRSGSAVFDFEGTGHEIFGNLNAPPAVTTSAVIYSLRCLLPDSDIPLNQGCLNPIEIKIPKNSVLNPSDTAAVVGGNVLTSQRVTDVVLLAFRACAASQGCMNNLTFGDETMGYYETIAGGAGAGATWAGCSAVHTHMTNTRITDPEILERRYPVVLRQFSIRRGSGGVGRNSGGDGVVRELQFTKPLVVSILSERRAFQPYGMAGGGPGQRGQNLLRYHRDGRLISLGGKNTISVEAGDVLTIMSPGGGGYGCVEAAAEEDTAAHSRASMKRGRDASATAYSAAAAVTVAAAAKYPKTSGSLHQYTISQESV